MKIIIRRALGVAGTILFVSSRAFADEQTGPESWSIHAQTTVLEQYHPSFKSPYEGPNSLRSADAGRETFDATLFLGARLWEGGEAYVNPEVDQGFGLSDTLGVAGFPSGEAYKVGKAAPYFRLHRLFFRQIFDLGGDQEAVLPDQNQLGGSQSRDHLTITAGKFSVPDIFDTNSYAHDAKSDFMNWSIIESGGFDYAADAWGYTYGLAVEWYQDWWTLRTGLFDLSRVPNTTELVRGLGQYELVAEGEARYALGALPGKVKLLGYYNRARMGSYNDALAAALALDSVPDTALVRRPVSRPGMALNLEQQIDDRLGTFARVSWNDGSKEAYDFTEIHHSAVLGLSLNGTDWRRPGDAVGLAVVVNGISQSARRYFAAGGLGILIGDGALPKYGNETIAEAYYKATLIDWVAVSADYQFIANPAYAGARGPVSVLGLRLHAQL
jgi:high affinity Mn2+ porin